MDLEAATAHADPITHPHEILGLPARSTADDVRKAYRKLARTCHPDMDPSAGAAERFIAVKAAHDEMLRRIEIGDIPSAGPLEPSDHEPRKRKTGFEDGWIETEFPVRPTTWRDLVRPAVYLGAAVFWLVIFTAVLLSFNRLKDFVPPPKPPGVRFIPVE